jgi:hypothetical protein
LIHPWVPELRGTMKDLVLRCLAEGTLFVWNGRKQAYIHLSLSDQYPNIDRPLNKLLESWTGWILKAQMQVSMCVQLFFFRLFKSSNIVVVLVVP